MTMATSQLPIDDSTQQATLSEELPIVIVGNGPVGIHAANELLRRNSDRPMVIYGKEPWKPYNRVRLSSFLVGEVDLEELTTEIEDGICSHVTRRWGYEVTDIDPKAKTVVDSSGRTQPYRKLILALGSKPHIPNIPGHNLNGVFTFRNLNDADRLMARTARSRRVIVIGGGLLGLETARGMQKDNTKVIVVDHADRLLSRQLDVEASRRLVDFVESMGISVLLNSAVKKVSGDLAATGVELFSGRSIECDTVIVATGIVPNIELAKKAGLKTTRGINVDDAMRTSDPDIYAVGECAEHRGQVYGLVAPGFEQAAVAAHNLCGGQSEYQGSVSATSLKVLGKNIFSIGPMAESLSSAASKFHRYQSSDLYRNVLIRKFRLRGALAVGSWREQPRIVNAVAKRQWIMPWQLWRFRNTGRLWPEAEADEITQWPETATVCQCTGVTRGQISQAITAGASSIAEVTTNTGAGSVCGSCRPLVQNLLGSSVRPEPVRWSQGLIASALIAVLTTLLFLFAPVIPYAESVQSNWHWDALWRDGFLKQVSGFSVLGIFIVGLSITPRKRWQFMRNRGDFDIWRWVHIATGLLVLAALLAHTGLRLGYGLNLWLMLGFIGLILAGGLLTLSIALEHRLDASMARRMRSAGLWLHLLLFWPVPALLGFHILESYYF